MMLYRTCGASGVTLPVLSVAIRRIGGSTFSLRAIREFCVRAVEADIKAFDISNTAGPPAGAAEVMFGTFLKGPLAGLREKLTIATRVGRHAWEGPYGYGGSRKHLVASLDQSLKRLGLEYVDIFYVERPEDEGELLETANALTMLVQQGKTRYVGVTFGNARRAGQLAGLLRQLGIASVVLQTAYSLVDRRLETQGVIEDAQRDAIAFVAESPIAKGYLRERTPAGLTLDGARRRKALMDIAAARGQSLPQMALSWVLRKRNVTSALLQPDDVGTLDEAIGALGSLEFTAQESEAISLSAFDIHRGDWRAARGTGPAP